MVTPSLAPSSNARRIVLGRIEAAARSFLHHQVRNMVGTLVEVGKGRRPEAWVAEVLASRDRTKAGPTAPPQGLVLEEVFYGEGPPPRTSGDAADVFDESFYPEQQWSPFEIDLGPDRIGV